MQVKDPSKAEAHKQRKAARARQWRSENPELSAQKARERYERDPVARREAVQRWRERHPEQLAEIRRASLLKKYGLTIPEYEALLVRQDSKCAICRSGNSGTKNGVFVVDHDHETGAVRGLLCRPCNIALGLFQDDRIRLEAAIHYLTPPPCERTAFSAAGAERG